MPSDDIAIDLVRTALVVTLQIAGPILVCGIVIGLAISIFQSVTQIQEQSLALVPKIVAMVVLAVILMPWIFSHIADFAIDMFTLM